VNKKEIKEKLENAIKNLFINQEDIFEFTSESGATEWNLAHHLAFEIQKEFPQFQHDIELTKSSFEYKRPDIVLHKRGNHNNNFLVIEVKYQKNTQNDINKIKNYWFEHPLRYKFGASIRIDNPNEYIVKIIRNEDRAYKPED